MLIQSSLSLLNCVYQLNNLTSVLFFLHTDTQLGAQNRLCSYKLLCRSLSLSSLSVPPSYIYSCLWVLIFSSTQSTKPVRVHFFSWWQCISGWALLPQPSCGLSPSSHLSLSGPTWKALQMTPNKWKYLNIWKWHWEITDIVLLAWCLLLFRAPADYRLIK